jgi:hypothetical protein
VHCHGQSSTLSSASVPFSAVNKKPLQCTRAWEANTRIHTESKRADGPKSTTNTNIRIQEYNTRKRNSQQSKAQSTTVLQKTKKYVQGSENPKQKPNNLLFKHILRILCRERPSRSLRDHITSTDSDVTTSYECEELRRSIQTHRNLELACPAILFELLPPRIRNTTERP